MAASTAPAPKRALVVDDEAALAQLVADYLIRDGFEVRVEHDGIRAVATAREFDPDLVVLDLGLPGLDGIEVCRQIRTFSECYVVMLTARADEIDTLVGLSVGADDYLTKPFSPRELAARAQAMLRRPRRTSPDEEATTHITFGALSIGIASREVTLNGSPVALTRTEFDLLATLALRPFHVHSRRSLIDAVWGDNWLADEHVVDVHLLHVRQKLGDDAARQQYIQTYRGVGYRMGKG